MKKRNLYITLCAISIALASCKKDKTSPVDVPEPTPEVVAEDTNYITVANTIDVSAILEGAKFEWQNASKKAVTLKIKYTEEGLNKEKVIENSTDIEGTTSIPITTLTNFSILVSNTGGKGSVTRLLGILPLLKPETKLAKAGWTASASSEINDPDEELNGAENIVDDVSVMSVTSPSSPSFWQSDYYLDPIFPYPHWLTVDMKKASKITKIGLNAHVDANQGFTSFKIEGSVDGIVFVDISGGLKTFNPALQSEQIYAVTPAGPIRYVKITLLAGSPYPCLGNFEAYARQ